MEMEKLVNNLVHSSPGKSMRTFSSSVIEKDLMTLGFSKDICGEDWVAVVKGVTDMINDPMRRGLFMIGEPGVGKTFLMKKIRAFARKRTNIWVDCADKESLDELLTGDYYYRFRGIERWECNYYLDDLGTDQVVQEFGNRIDVVSDFILKFYNKGNGRLFITTNLHNNVNDPALMNRYGQRILDRIYDKCIVLPMKGKSKRNKELIK